MKKFPRFGFTLLCALLILAVCLVDFSKAPQMKTFAGFDKLVHFLMYFVLTAIYIWEFRFRKNPFRKDSPYYSTGKGTRLFGCCLLLSGLFGGLVEGLQGLTTYRSLDAYDWVADMMGGLFAFLFYYILSLLRRRHTLDNL